MRQCLDGDCYRAKLAAHIASSIERNPELIRISSAWGTPTEGVLSRGQYVEIATRSSRNGHGKLTPEQKKCPHVTKAIVVEGGNGGRIVDVCANPTCETHHGESRKAHEAEERMRSEQRKQQERAKLELATRKHVMAAILEKVSAPLARADLDLVTRQFIHWLPQDHRILLAERHSPAAINDKRAKASAEIEGALKNLDEAGYVRLLMEMSLLDAACSSYAHDAVDRLEAVAKRYRVNVQKISEAVASEFAARKQKSEQRRKDNAGKEGARKDKGG